MSEVIKNDVICESCVHAARATKSGGPMSQLTNLKAYKEGSSASKKVPFNCFQCVKEHSVHT